MKYEVDTLDGVDEAVRPLYEEKDGKFRLKVDGLPKPEDTAGLKSALQKERDRAKVAEKYEALGVSPEDIQKMLEAKEAAERKKLEDEGDFKSILAQHQKTWSEKEQKLVSERDGAVTGLQKYVGESALTTALARSGATEEGLALLPSQYLSRIKVGLDGDRPSIAFVQADGETPMAGTSENGTATMEDLVAEAVKKFPSLFKSDARGGGGKPQEGGAGRNATGKTWADAKSAKEKAEILKSRMQ